MKHCILAAALMFAPLNGLAAIRAEQPSALVAPRGELPESVVSSNRTAWVLGGLGALVILAAWCWPRRKPPLMAPRPIEIARQKIESLQSGELPVTPVSVAAVVRVYAADTFGTERPGVTSEELVSGLANHRVCPVELTNAVWHFLSDCDRAKFSPNAAAPDGAALVGNASKLIESLEAAREKASRTL